MRVNACFMKLMIQLRRYCRFTAYVGCASDVKSQVELELDPDISM